jgi:hypothetical protein
LFNVRLFPTRVNDRQLPNQSVFQRLMRFRISTDTYFADRRDVNREK